MITTFQPRNDPKQGFNSSLLISVAPSPSSTNITASITVNTREEQSETTHLLLPSFSLPSFLHKKPVKNAVVAVRVEPGHECSTKPAPDSGTSPRWNENLIVDLPPHAGFITVEVKCKSSSGSYKVVGGAMVPVSDFAGDLGTPEGYMHFLSYRLRDSNGVQTDGIINISAKMAAPAPTYEVPRLQIGVPVGYQRKMMAAGGLVIGVPVWYAQPCRC